MKRKLLALALFVLAVTFLISPPLAIICLGFAISVFVMAKANPETGLQMSTLTMLAFLALAFFAT
jgi:hypothetical protein